MVTNTQNDNSPELLAHARRGPCSPALESELVEHLLSHHRTVRPKTRISEDPTAAVVSFQRRNQALKTRFMKLNHRTPLGICVDTWDRTEAQTRQALHTHIPFWARERTLPLGYCRVPSKQEEAAIKEGTNPGHLPPETQEDHIYMSRHLARVYGKLIRPHLHNPKAWSRDLLLWPMPPVCARL